MGCAGQDKELGTLRAQILIEAAKRRLHHNVLAIALANKLARIAWAVLAKGHDFEVTRKSEVSPQLA